MSIGQFIKKKKQIAVAENRKDIDSGGRLSSDLYQHIFASEKRDINGRLKFIGKDLDNLVKNN